MPAFNTKLSNSVFFFYFIVKLSASSFQKAFIDEEKRVIIKLTELVGTNKNTNTTTQKS